MSAEIENWADNLALFNPVKCSIVIRVQTSPQNTHPIASVYVN